MFSSELKVAIAKEVLTNDGSDYLHDVIFDATNESLSFEELQKIFYSLPEDIQCDALKWGLNDTEVRGGIYAYLIKKVKDDE